MQGVIIAPIWLGGNCCKRGLLTHWLYNVITNETNGDGGTAGDVVSTSIYRISENTAAIKENEFADVQILLPVCGKTTMRKK